ncbi:hypothetical protein [Diaphorobacter sp.]|uniref:hypothetical protein n=1 Tax=Diaphorobacter sp. TaxID=1934310 RepID=UPI003D0F47C9
MTGIKKRAAPCTFFYTALHNAAHTLRCNVCALIGRQCAGMPVKKRRRMPRRFTQAAGNSRSYLLQSGFPWLSAPLRAVFLRLGFASGFLVFFTVFLQPILKSTAWLPQ